MNIIIVENEANKICIFKYSQLNYRQVKEKYASIWQCFSVEHHSYTRWFEDVTRVDYASWIIVLMVKHRNVVQIK